MRSVPVGLLLAIWITLGSGLAILHLSTWIWPETVGGWSVLLQQAYNAGPDPPWLLRADTHVHTVVAFLATIWCGLGCRLFAPRSLPWLALSLPVLVLATDELARLGSERRHFAWSDHGADAIGILIALPLLLLLRQIEVVRQVRRRRDATRRS